LTIVFSPHTIVSPTIYARISAFLIFWIEAAGALCTFAYGISTC